MEINVYNMEGNFDNWVLSAERFQELNLRGGSLRSRLTQHLLFINPPAAACSGIMYKPKFLAVTRVYNE